MSTFDTLLDGVPVDRIRSEAREVQVTRTLLTLLGGLFWVLGWLAGTVCTAVWLALAFVVTAVRIGWSDARPSPPRS